MSCEPTLTDEEPANWFGYRQPGRGQVDVPEQLPDPTLTDEQFYDPAVRCLVADKAQGSGVCGAAVPCPEHPTLSDEELAEIESSHKERCYGSTYAYCEYCEDSWPCPTSRLIAALRASRAEVERLGAGMERSVQHRCPNIARHRPGPGCPCHPSIPAPCDDCYAIEVLSRKVPYSALASHPAIPSIPQIPTSAPRHSPDALDPSHPV